MVDPDGNVVGQLLAGLEGMGGSKIEHQTNKVTIGGFIEDRVESLRTPLRSRLRIHKQSRRQSRNEAFAIVDHRLARPASKALGRCHHRLTGSIVAPVADRTAGLENRLGILP